ncbi:MAG: copper resistance protein CopC, partial [Chloroflexi bacterium]|nr:copper resistance protein CopC [Chloroflexota bacterium]
MRRHLLVILSALLLSCLLYSGSSIVMQPPLALAHAFVIGSDPVDGSTINTVPSVVRIFFNATISPISVAHVYSIQDGKLVNVGAARSSLAPTNPRELDIPVQTPDSQPQGSYEVIWTAVANDDGHTTYGIIGFNVGFSSTGLSGVATLGPSTSNNLDGVGGVRTLDFLGVLSVAWEWLILLALTFWIGILVMERLLLKGAGRASALLDRARKQALPLQWLCLCALLFGEAVTLVLRTSRLSQVLNVGGFDFTALYVLV